MYISSHGKPQTAVKKLRHCNFHLVLDIRGVPERCTREELVEYSWDIFEIQKADNNAISLIPPVFTFQGLSCLSGRFAARVLFSSFGISQNGSGFNEAVIGTLCSGQLVFQGAQQPGSAEDVYLHRVGFDGIVLFFS